MIDLDIPFENNDQFYLGYVLDNSRVSLNDKNLLILHMINVTSNTCMLYPCDLPI